MKLGKREWKRIARRAPKIAAIKRSKRAAAQAKRIRGTHLSTLLSAEFSSISRRANPRETDQQHRPCGLAPEYPVGISEQKPKPCRRDDNQRDRRDKIQKAILHHQSRARLGTVKAAGVSVAPTAGLVELPADGTAWAVFGQSQHDT
jgi:hypothetical protein